MPALQSTIPAEAANCTFRHHFVPSRKVDVSFPHAGSKNKTPLCKVHYKVLLCKERETVLHRTFLISNQASLTFHPTFKAVCDNRISKRPARSGAGLPRSLLFKVQSSDVLKRLYRYIQKYTGHTSDFVYYRSC